MLIELRETPGGSADFSTGDRRQYIHRFYARSNNPFDRQLNVVRDPLLRSNGLVIGERDPFDPRCTITGVQPVRRQRTTKIWDLTVVSSNETQAEDRSPLEEPVRVRLHADQRSIPVSLNARGELILNKARSIIPLSKEVSDWVFTVEKNVRSIPAYVLGMNNKINRGTFVFRGLVLPARKVQIKGMQAIESEAIHQGRTLQFVTFGYQLHFRREGWKVKFPNVDFMELDTISVVRRTRGSGGTRIVRDADGLPVYDQKPVGRKFIEIGGERVTEPWPLDRKGKALGEDYKASEIVTLEEDLYEETSFDLLPR
jgi:hypothetical protein